jgi:hypothetical protein
VRRCDDDGDEELHAWRARRLERLECARRTARYVVLRPRGERFPVLIATRNHTDFPYQKHHHAHTNGDRRGLRK